MGKALVCCVFIIITFVCSIATAEKYRYDLIVNDNGMFLNRSEEARLESKVLSFLSYRVKVRVVLQRIGEPLSHDKVARVVNSLYYPGFVETIRNSVILSYIEHGRGANVFFTIWVSRSLGDLGWLPSYLGEEYARCTGGSKTGEGSELFQCVMVTLQALEGIVRM